MHPGTLANIIPPLIKLFECVLLLLLVLIQHFCYPQTHSDSSASVGMSAGIRGMSQHSQLLWHNWSYCTCQVLVFKPLYLWGFGICGSLAFGAALLRDNAISGQHEEGTGERAGDRWEKVRQLLCSSLSRLFPLAPQGCAPTYGFIESLIKASFLFIFSLLNGVE